MKVSSVVGLLSMLVACSPGPGAERTTHARESGEDPTLVFEASETEPTTGFLVDRIWTSKRVTGSSPVGDIQVTPDPGHVLMIVDVTARGQSPVTVEVDQLAAHGAAGRVPPVGAAPISPSSFTPFSSFVSGWKIVSDAEGREVRIGRDSESQPIALTVAPGARVSIVYIVPEEGQPMVVTVPGAGEVPLVPSS